MNDRVLLALRILGFVTVVGGLVAIFVPSSKRTFWIVWLSILVFEFGGIAVGIAFRGVSHRHLSTKGFFMLLVNGYAAWFIFQYLLEKIARRTVNRATDSN